MNVYVEDTVTIKDLRGAYQEMFRKSCPKYHLTLTFKFGVNDRVATDLLNTFIDYMNKTIFKKAYTKHAQAMKGFVVKESTPSMRNVHFHILITDPDGKLPELIKMKEIISRKIINSNRTVGEKDKISKNLIQDYYEGNEASSLEGYLTKIFERHDLTKNEKINSICALGPEPVSFS